MSNELVKLLHDLAAHKNSDTSLASEAADLIEQQAARIAELQSERDAAELMLLARKARITELEAALRRITSTYDAYRRRGVSPAPAEYGDVVAAIEAARTALASKEKA